MGYEGRILWGHDSKILWSMKVGYYSNLLQYSRDKFFVHGFCHIEVWSDGVFILNYIKQRERND